MPQMSRRVYAFVGLVTALAIAMVVAVVRTTATPTAADWTAALVFGSFAALATILKYRSYGSRMVANMAFLPLMSACVIAPNGASIAVVVAVELIGAVLVRTTLLKRLWNVSHHTLAIALSLVVYRLAGGEPLRAFSFASLVPFIAFYATGKLLNKLLMSFILGLTSGRSWQREFYNLQGAFIFDLLVMPMAYAFALGYVTMPPALTVLFILPLVALRDVYKQNAELLEKNVELLQLMVASIEARDPYTSGHSRRVSRYAEAIATVSGVTEKIVQRITMAAMLHDIGKIHEEFAPILRKPDRLNEEEFAAMQTHAAKGATIIAKAASLADLIPAVRHHHERWDGEGYPDRLIGGAIPIMARIITIADTIDAMTTDRPYRQALDPDEVFREAARVSGTQFDPELVAYVLSPNGRAVLRRIMEEEATTMRTVACATAAAAAAENAARKLTPRAMRAVS